MYIVWFICIQCILCICNRSLHLSHHQKELVPWPRFAECGNIQSLLAMNGVINGLSMINSDDAYEIVIHPIYFN